MHKYINSFVNFISKSKQIIEPTNAVIFEKSNSIFNIDFKNNTNYITILNSGIYIINLNAHFTNTCNLGLFINNLPDLSTINYSKSGIINIYQIIKLIKNDKLSIRNYDSFNSITTMDYNQSNNINFNITQIS